MNLRPVLFLLFVNDISRGSTVDNAKTSIYVDDVQYLFIRLPNKLEDLKEDAETPLTYIDNWHTTFGLKFMKIKPSALSWEQNQIHLEYSTILV